MSIEDYSEADFQKALEIYIDYLTWDARSCSCPIAYLTGGQPGSGKSAFHDLALSEQKNNLIIIEPDAFRSMHPNYDALVQKYGKDSVIKTQKFAGFFAEALIARLSDSCYNLLIEGTLRTTDVPCKTAELLRKKGYRVELLVMAVKPAISLVSTIERYERMLNDNPKMARSTPKNHHDQIAANLCSNLGYLYAAALFDEIRLYNRKLTLLYSSEEAPKKDPSGIIKDIMEGAWSADEAKMVRASIQNIYCLLKNRNAEGTDDWKAIERMENESGVCLT